MKDITQRFLYSYNYLIPILGLIILSDRLLLGKYAIHKTHDGFDSFIPIMNQIIEKVYSFQLPGWNSDYLGGLPFNFMDNTHLEQAYDPDLQEAIRQSLL